MSAVPHPDVIGKCRVDHNYTPAGEAFGPIEGKQWPVLDQSGVGQLMQIATTRGRATRPDLKIGICGEHGGETESVKFCHRIGLTYVACSPFRLLTARLAAAQAAVEDELAQQGAGAQANSGTR